MRPRRNVNSQSGQAHRGDVQQFAGHIVQWRMEPERIQANQRLAVRVLCRIGFRRGPDAQPASLGPQAPFAAQPVAGRNAEGIQLNACMKMLT